MKRLLIIMIGFLLAFTTTNAQRKITTDKVQITKTKDAHILATDGRGNVYDNSLILDTLASKSELENIDLSSKLDKGSYTGTAEDLKNEIDAIPKYQAGNNITIDTTNPDSPIISANTGSASDDGSSELQKITENNNTGWRLRGVDPEYYGDIGNKAVDLSVQYNKLNKGATGYGSFAANVSHASGSISSAFNEGYSGGMGSVSFNKAQVGDAQYASAFNIATVYKDAEYASAFNHSTSKGHYSSSFGISTTAYSYAEHVIGTANTIYNGSETSYNSEDRLFVIGNGVDSQNRSDALIVFKNGKIIAPSLELEEIVSPKSLVTKEYLSSSISTIFDEINVLHERINELEQIIFELQN